ncbi:hypothetical protein BKA93DRAFT_882053 [Sparassis latifolia]
MCDGMALLEVELNTSCGNIPRKPPPSYTLPTLAPLLAVLATFARADPSVALRLKLPPYSDPSVATGIDVYLHKFTYIFPEKGPLSRFAFLVCTNTLGSGILFASKSGPSLCPRSPPWHRPRCCLPALVHPSAAVRNVGIIGVGGVLDAPAARRMRAAGASAVTCATALGVRGVCRAQAWRGGVSGLVDWYRELRWRSGRNAVVTRQNNWPAFRNEYRLGLVNSAPYLCCGIIGCWVSAPMNKYFSRRGTIFISATVSFVTCIWQGLTNTWWHLFIARFFLGFDVGPKSATVPVYAADCAPASTRGGLAMAGVPAVFIMFQVFFCCPESPRWLMSKDRYPEAYDSLLRLRNSPIQAARDLYYIHVLLEAEEQIMGGRNRFLELFTEPRNWRATLASFIVMFMQQFCGVNVIAGLSETSALIASWGFGMLNWVFAFPAVKTIDTFGRRNLLLTTFPLMAIFLLVTGFAFWIPPGKGRLAVVALGIYLYIICYSPGEGPVPFTYSAEAFPLVTRDVGMSFATAIFWFLWPRGAFGWYAGWNVIGFFLILLFVLETKALSLEELDQVFSVPTHTHAAYQVKALPHKIKKHFLRMKVDPLPPLYEFEATVGEKHYAPGSLDGRSPSRSDDPQECDDLLRSEWFCRCIQNNTHEEELSGFRIQMVGAVLRNLVLGPSVRPSHTGQIRNLSSGTGENMSALEGVRWAGGTGRDTTMRLGGPIDTEPDVAPHRPPIPRLPPPSPSSFVVARIGGSSPLPQAPVIAGKHAAGGETRVSLVSTLLHRLDFDAAETFGCGGEESPTAKACPMLQVPQGADTLRESGLPSFVTRAAVQLERNGLIVMQKSNRAWRNVHSFKPHRSTSLSAVTIFIVPSSSQRYLSPHQEALINLQRPYVPVSLVVSASKVVRENANAAPNIAEQGTGWNILTRDRTDRTGQDWTDWTYRLDNWTYGLDIQTGQLDIRTGHRDIGLAEKSLIWERINVFVNPAEKH